MRSFFAVLLCVWTFCVVKTAMADGVEDPRPEFKRLRFEEDWSNFSTDQAVSPLDKTKHVQINDDIWVSFSGRTRLRMEIWNNQAFDDNNDDTYYTYRAFFSTDWHFGEHFRVWLEGRYSGLTDRDLPGGKRPVQDVDRLDAWNAFLEGRWDCGDLDFTVRVGRQQFDYGRYRLLEAGNWNNNCRIFDGVLFRIAKPDAKWKLDVFTVMPVIVDPRWFTWNNTDNTRLFGGAYFTKKLESRHTVEAYFFSLDAVRETPTRDYIYTVGSRAIGPIAGNLSFEVEGAFQFGSRAISATPKDTHLDIVAGSFSTEITYTFKQVDWTPYLAAKFEYGSGDADPKDHVYGDFNPLFATGHDYFGYVDAIGRSNMLDPNVTIGAWPIPKKLHLKLDGHLFWLADKSDGLYTASNALARSPQFKDLNGRALLANDRQVGQEIDVTAIYFVNRYFTLQSGYSHFFTGRFLHKTGLSRDEDFGYLQGEFTF